MSGKAKAPHNTVSTLEDAGRLWDIVAPRWTFQKFGNRNIYRDREHRKMFYFYAVPITHKLSPSSDAEKVLQNHIDKRNRYFHLAFRMHRGVDPCVTEKAKSEFISMTAYLHQTHQFTEPHGCFLNGGLKHLDGHDVVFKPLPCEPKLPSVPWYPREAYMHVTVGKQAQPPMTVKNLPQLEQVNSQGVPISTFIDSQLYRDRITHGSSDAVYDSLPESVKVALREGKLTRSRLLE